MTNYNPEKWLETATRGVKDYVEANLNTRIYEVVMEFPGPAVLTKMPLPKTLIHFEIDDIADEVLGMGDTPVLDNYNDEDGTTNPQWAAVHTINFDVGIWASDKSGGTTARMRARQELQRLFGFPSSVAALRAATDAGDGAVEITRYRGGMFAIDSQNDVRLYRMMNGELEVRVFSRTPLSDTPSPAITSIEQAPDLSIIG